MRSHLVLVSPQEKGNSGAPSVRWAGLRESTPAPSPCFLCHRDVLPRCPRSCSLEGLGVLQRKTF